jgi:hypothetical protein
MNKSADLEATSKTCTRCREAKALEDLCEWRRQAVSSADERTVISKPRNTVFGRRPSVMLTLLSEIGN